MGCGRSSNVRRHWNRDGSNAALRHHVPRMRSLRRGGNAHRRAHLFLPVQRVSQIAASSAGRLLCVPFLWECQMSAGATRQGLLCVDGRQTNVQQGVRADREPWLLRHKSRAGRSTRPSGSDNSGRFDRLTRGKYPYPLNYNRACIDARQCSTDLLPESCRMTNASRATAKVPRLFAPSLWSAESEPRRDVPRIWR